METERKVYIYVLEYPFGEVRYIGKTTNPKKRFQRHINDARKYTTSHKLAWIRSLLNQGIKPYMNIIDEVPESEWQKWEQHYIKEAKELGFDLTNGTIGGDGNHEPNEEVRSKISNTLKEYFKKNSVWNKGKKGVSVGWTKGKKRTAEDAKANSERKKEYFRTHTVWNYGTSSKTPDPNYKGRTDLKTREILQFTLEGEFVAEYRSQSIAAHTLGFPSKMISKCLRGKRPEAYGYIWKYKDEYTENQTATV